MRTHFTLLERRSILAAAFILLIAGAGCKPISDRCAYHVQLSADPAENCHLTGIFFSRNKDSIVKCADADYKENKYYIFRMPMHFEGKFDDYLAVYARQKYGLTIVNCGYKNYPGACYYNAEMAEYFSKANIKSLGAIYLEAKSNYNKELQVPYADH